MKLEEIFTSNDKGLWFFDPETIREKWKPVAIGFRHPCSHYHTHHINDWVLVDTCPSGFVVATDESGVSAIVRIREQELVGIMSMIAIEDTISEENLEAVDLWIDSICLKLT